MYTVVLGQFGDDYEIYTEYVHASDGYAAIDVARDAIHNSDYHEMDREEFMSIAYTVFAVFNGWHKTLV